MSRRTRSLAAVAIVVCASLVALAVQGMVEWVSDLLVTGGAALAARLRARPLLASTTVDESPNPVMPRRPPRHRSRLHPPARRPPGLRGPGWR